MRGRRHRLKPAAPAQAHERLPGRRRRRSKLRRSFLRGLVFGARRRVGVIGLDDLLHQLVPDDVLVVEVDDADAVDLVDDFQRFNQAR